MNSRKPSMPHKTTFKTKEKKLCKKIMIQNLKNFKVFFIPYPVPSLNLVFDKEIQLFRYRSDLGKLQNNKKVLILKMEDLGHIPSEKNLCLIRCTIYLITNVKKNNSLNENKIKIKKFFLVIIHDKIKNVIFFILNFYFCLKNNFSNFWILIILCVEEQIEKIL